VALPHSRSEAAQLLSRHTCGDWAQELARLQVDPDVDLARSLHVHVWRGVIVGVHAQGDTAFQLEALRRQAQEEAVFVISGCALDSELVHRDPPESVKDVIRGQSPVRDSAIPVGPGVERLVARPCLMGMSLLRHSRPASYRRYRGTAISALAQCAASRSACGTRGRRGDGSHGLLRDGAEVRPSGRCRGYARSIAPRGCVGHEADAQAVRRCTGPRRYRPA